MRDDPLNDSVLQVRNVERGLVHLCSVLARRGAKSKSLCGLWTCDTPSKLSEAAEFASNSATWTAANSVFGFCERCYGDAYPTECVCVPDSSLPHDKAEGSDSDSTTSSSSES